MPPFERVLISNRGEIAIRIAKAASALGMESVGVFAPVDSLSLHTRLVTDSRVIGNGAAVDPVGAYLDAEELVRTAQESGCDCVHPGYGFLAENAPFAALCASEGITFVGPSPAALALFGDKVRARQLARSLDIPVVPGSSAPTATPDEARTLAAELGYPVMLKAAAGGGGRGMRAVDCAEAMGEAFKRCRGEAEAAFGNGAVFVEKLVRRPRHIEVQVLADAQGNTVHLHERDCSVQLRNQKVVETAPAPELDDALRQQVLADAVKLVRAADYVNAGTVEFLVVPETGAYFFIECNPRIQVEHTVTEQVTGIDLVEAQFRIAAGERLDSLGIGSQQAVGAARGFAVQARVVGRGAGTLRAYKEPSGPGVRVDACGYVGYAPPPQFDPLLAKVIASSAAPSVASAVDRTRRALAEFHIGGLATNLAQLQAILSHPAVRSGDARTTLLAEEPALLSPAAGANGSGALALLQQQATVMGASALAGPGAAAAETPLASLDAEPGQEAVACPMAGSVLEVRGREGDRVAAGDALLIISAMKMESEVAAPCAGVVAAAQPLSPGDSVAAGQVFAVIAPADGARPPRRSDGEDTWAPLPERRGHHEGIGPQAAGAGLRRPRRGPPAQPRQAHLPGAHRPPARRGQLPRSSSVAGFASYDEDGAVTAFTPANHVGGWGRIEGRSAVVCADDFTSRGGHADGAIGAKSGYLDRLSLELRMPSIACSTAPPAAAASPPWCRRRRRQARARPRRAAARSRPAGPGWRAAAVPSCPDTSAAPCTPSSWPPCRW